MNCPECGQPGTPFTHLCGGRVGYLCRRCPKKLVKKGHEIGFILSGPRWLGPPSPPAPKTLGPHVLSILAAAGMLGAPRP